MCSDGHKLAQNPLGGDGGKGRFLYADELGKHLPLSSSSPPALFIKPISILKAGRNPSVQRIFICLTQCFPNSRVLPSQNSDSPFTESPEGVNPGCVQGDGPWEGQARAAEAATPTATPHLMALPGHLLRFWASLLQTPFWSLKQRGLLVSLAHPHSLSLPRWGLRLRKGSGEGNMSEGWASPGIWVTSGGGC